MLNKAVMKSIIDFFLGNKYFKAASGSILSLLGLFFLYLSLTPVDASEYIKSDNDLTEITAPLLEKPYYNEFGKSVGLFLRLNGYNRINFRNESDFFEATDFKGFTVDAHFGDTVTIKVDKKNFEKWYLKIDSLSLFEQIILRPPNFFNFYSLRFRGKEYVGDVYAIAKKRKNSNLPFYILLSAALIGVGIYIIIVKK
jgi:hypothetical protein